MPKKVSDKEKENGSARKTLVLLDAHALIHRAYHALPPFATASGEPTGAVYGFLAMILKIMEDFRPDYVAACYDLPGGTFRHEAYKEYKGGRKETDDDLRRQLQTSRDACSAFSIPIYDAPGFEADDVLGTIAAQMTNKNTDGIAHDNDIHANVDIDVIIASGDMDTLQLVDADRVRVYTLKKGIKDTVLYNEDAVRERFGFGPELLPDYKGLRGDPSDNIIGIKGIGEKTAETLISNFGSLEQIYDMLEKKPEAFKKYKITDRIIGLLKNGHDEALFSKVLATIRRDAPVTYTIPNRGWYESLHTDAIEAFCNTYELRAIWKRMQPLLQNTNGSGDNKKEKEENTIGDADMTVDEGKEIYDTGDASIKIKKREKDGSVSGNEKNEEKEKRESISDEVAVQENNDEVRELGIMTWLVNSDKTHPSLGDIYEHTGAHTLPAARQKLIQKITELGLEKIYSEIELPLIPIVAGMRDHGMVLDTKYLAELSKEMHTELDQLEKNIFHEAGQEFNVRSPQQLGEILFQKLGLSLKGIKKTAGGAISTRESELEKLRGLHPIIDVILRYRELYKLVSTYIDALPLLVDEHSRLHAELLQDGTSTGRFSCQNPNLQNIPIRTEEGRKIRHAFVAPAGYQLVVCDYSQIELRLAAMMSGDPLLVQTFVDNQDVHTAVAAQVFGVAPDAVDHEQRRRAKIINFGILYGMGVNALQQNLESTRAEAQEFYNLYFERFPKIREYMDVTKTFAYAHGYTETLFGRRRSFPSLRSPLPHIRASAERMAINAPIQGTEADCIKLAMRYLDEWIQREGLQDDVHMVLQVHDELIFEVKTEKVPEVMPIIEDIMTSVLEKSWIHYKTPVPLKVSIHTGTSWGAAKE